MVGAHTGPGSTGVTNALPLRLPSPLGGPALHRALTTLSLLWATSASAVCPDDVSSDALAQHLSRAEQAWTALDGAGFSGALDDITFLLPCLTEPVSPNQAARTHRAFALQAFGDGQERSASAAFRAGHAASPAAGSPEALLPSGHAALTLYENSRAAVEYSPLDPEPIRPLLFDGTAGVQRPLDVPTVAQVLGEDGSVQHTRYVNPGQQLPAYDAVAPTKPTPLPTLPPTSAEPRVHRGLNATLGTLTTVAALSTAGLAGASIWSHQEFNADHPAWGLRELDARRERTNTLTLGAAAAGAITATAGLTWVIVR